MDMRTVMGTSFIHCMCSKCHTHQRSFQAAHVQCNTCRCRCANSHVKCCQCSRLMYIDQLIKRQMRFITVLR
jgi:hypothetical protein